MMGASCVDLGKEARYSQEATPDYLGKYEKFEN